MTVEANDAPVEIIYDNPNPESPAVEPGSPVQEHVAPEPEPQEEARPLTAREEIAARFKAKRREEEGEAVAYNPIDTTPPFIKQAQEEADAAARAAEDERVAAEEQATPAEAPSNFTIKVRGQDMTMSRADLIKAAELEPEEAEGLPASSLVRLAQKQLAASSYLDDAKSTAKERRLAAPAPGQHQTDDSANDAEQDDDQSQGDRNTSVDPELIKAIERIQYGSPEEAAATLAEVVDRQLNKAKTQEFAPRHQAEVREALDGFNRDYSDLLGDDDLGELVLQRSLKEVRNEVANGLIAHLKATGQEPDEAGIRGRVETLITDFGTASKAYTEARMQGLKVRAPADLLKTAGDAIRSKFKPGTAPAVSPAADTRPALSTSRQEIKRGLPQQPSRANAQPIVPQGAPAPRSRQDVVAQMRKARGQSY